MEYRHESEKYVTKGVLLRICNSFLYQFFSIRIIELKKFESVILLRKEI